MISQDEQPDNGVAEPSQGRSTIKFPYLDLDDAVEIARTVHEIGGTSCQREQLAASLNVVPTGGGFNLRLVTARLFGFVAGEKGTVSLTDLGSRVCDPQQEKAARAEAFLLVPLYKALYENFRATTLPPSTGLESTIESLGVAPKQKDKARQAFLRSAAQAGFFAFGNNRLVLPAIKSGGDPEKVREEPRGNQVPLERKERELAGGRSLPPFVVGLLEKLPEPEGSWPKEGRKKWLQTAANIFDLMYSTDEQDTGELTISITRKTGAVA